MILNLLHWLKSFQNLKSMKNKFIYVVVVFFIQSCSTSVTRYDAYVQKMNEDKDSIGFYLNAGKYDIANTLVNDWDKCRDSAKILAKEIGYSFEGHEGIEFDKNDTTGKWCMWTERAVTSHSKCDYPNVWRYYVDSAILDSNNFKPIIIKYKNNKRIVVF